MAKLENNPIIKTDGQSILNEILSWQAELDNNIVDNIVYETLETVIDIIYYNSECELSYEHMQD